MDASSPPRYRRYSRHGLVPPSGSELPSYTRRNVSQVTASRQATEHLFHVFNAKGKKPWMTLKVYSSAKSSKSLPTFFEKEKINGLLEVDVEKGDSILAITATVCVFCSNNILYKSTYPLPSSGDWSYHHWV